MLYTDSALKTFKIGMTATLFNDADQFEQIDNTPLTEGPVWNLVKTGQAVSEKKTFKYYENLYMYIAQEQGQITPGENFDYNRKGFTALIIYSKLQWLVSDTFWETEFSMFPPYKRVGRQIWPCREKVKCQPRVIIWT